MVLSNQEQLSQLFYCLGFGALLSIYYDIFRLIRISKSASSVRLFVHDIVFCITSAVAFFLFTLALNGGEAHLPMTAAVTVGFTASHTTVGRLLMRCAAGFHIIGKRITAVNEKIDAFTRNLSKKVAVFFKKGLHCLYKIVYNQKQE